MEFIPGSALDTGEMQHAPLCRLQPSTAMDRAARRAGPPLPPALVQNDGAFGSRAALLLVMTDVSSLEAWMRERALKLAERAERSSDPAIAAELHWLASSYVEALGRIEREKKD